MRLKDTAWKIRWRWRRQEGFNITCSNTDPQGVEEGKNSWISVGFQLDWHKCYISDHQTLDYEDCIGVNYILMRIASEEKI